MTLTVAQPDTQKRASGVAMYANMGNGTEYMPERGWSRGQNRVDTRIARSNLHNTVFNQIAQHEKYDAYTAEILDGNGVTADQLAEAWNLMGEYSLELASKAMTRDGLNRICHDIADTSATTDMRYAYALVGDTLQASMAEAAPVAKRLGYEYFFTLAMSGMSLEAILSVDDSDIDPYIMGIVLDS